MKSKKINIAFGITNEESQHAGCVISSILSNSSFDDEYCFYIISDGISDLNKQKFEDLKSIRDFEINFVDLTDKDKSMKTKNLVKSTLFKLKMLNSIKVDKIIFFDIDVVVRKNVRELYDEDISEYHIAAVEDLLNCEPLRIQYGIDKDSVYINSGIILFNLKLCRKDKIAQKITYELNKREDISEQILLNRIFENKIKTIDIKWNCMYAWQNNYEDQNYYHEMARNPAIVHYILDLKPWIAGKTPYMKTEYFKYLKLTPWWEDFVQVYQIEENMLIFQKLNEIENKIYGR